MRSLLFHEFAHAVFAERTGGDRPFWLNEGLAELAERASRGEPGVSRSERALLRRRIDAGEWIPLEHLGLIAVQLAARPLRVSTEDNGTVQPG